jgi:hypothetical protein
MCEEVCATVVSFNDAVQMSELIIEIIDSFDKSQNIVESLELFDCVFISFGFEPVVELSRGRKSRNIAVEFALLR